MRPFAHSVTLLACLMAALITPANASPVMSCDHNTPSVPLSPPASTTASAFVQTPHRPPSPSSTPASAFTAPARAAGVVVPPSGVPSALAAAITQAPSANASHNCHGHDNNEKFVQTTYYSCVTMGTYTHCGWHEPILDASTSAAGRSARWTQTALWCLVVVAGVAVCL